MTKAERLSNYIKDMKVPNWREYWAAIDYVCLHIETLTDKEIDHIFEEEKQ